MQVPKYLKDKISKAIKKDQWSRETIVSILNSMEKVIVCPQSPRFTSRLELLLYFGIGKSDWFDFVLKDWGEIPKMKNKISLVDMACAINKQKESVNLTHNHTLR